MQSLPAAPESSHDVEIYHLPKAQDVEQAGKGNAVAKPGSEPEHDQILVPEQQQDLGSQDIEAEEAHSRTESEQQEQESGKQQTQEPPFSVFSVREKRFIVIMASLAALFSPLSANIYFPALNTLSADLHVSLTKINLTITTYLVCYPSPKPAQ